jgi:hypothetical protein
MGVQAADLRGLATDYAAFVGALQESLGGVWARAVASCWSSELSKWGAFSLGHAQVSQAYSWLAGREATMATSLMTLNTSRQTRSLRRRSQAGARCGRGCYSALGLGCRRSWRRGGRTGRGATPW